MLLRTGGLLQRCRQTGLLPVFSMELEGGPPLKTASYIGPQHWQHGTPFNFLLLLCTRHRSTFSLVLLPYEKNDKKTKESICLYINSCTDD